MSVNKYLQQLNEQEKHVLEIAKDHLGDSFDIERSIGYNEWVKKQNIEQTTTVKTPPQTKIIKRKKLRIKKK